VFRSPELILVCLSKGSVVEDGRLGERGVKVSVSFLGRHSLSQLLAAGTPFLTDWLFVVQDLTHQVQLFSGKFSGLARRAFLTRCVSRRVVLTAATAPDLPLVHCKSAFNLRNAVEKHLLIFLHLFVSLMGPHRRALLPRTCSTVLRLCKLLRQLRDRHVLVS
jgi:hypothetical protein